MVLSNSCISFARLEQFWSCKEKKSLTKSDFYTCHSLQLALHSIPPKFHVLIPKFLLWVLKSEMPCSMSTCVANSKEEFLTSMYAVCNKMRKCYVGNNNIKYCNWRMKNKARSLRLLNICLASLDASLNLDTGFPGTS